MTPGEIFLGRSVLAALSYDAERIIKLFYGAQNRFAFAVHDTDGTVMLLDARRDDKPLCAFEVLFMGPDTQKAFFLSVKPLADEASAVLTTPSGKKTFLSASYLDTTAFEAVRKGANSVAKIAEDLRLLLEQGAQG
jgi:hypothetical protein